ncbi:ABC transporter permease [Mycoplasma nasistruthionis]|uniref:ABC transporter permease n=1 Tax=Mycoplasma nasistruthionis TaxID=353852 RepID=A0A5B7XVL0_9MOLU|nr:ABC transporter permease [Mycoplasma nasistruthionis]QCZ36514.1 ABC transporter permease [Mycoplasma nasistruthionis]
MQITKNYIFYLHKIIFKKKSSFVIPVIWLVISVLLSIIFSFLSFNNKIQNFVIYSVVFAEIIFTIFYAALKSLNIYKDLEEEGVELLTYAKPITRKQIFAGKLSVFLIFGVYWALTTLFSNLFISLAVKSSYVAGITFLSLIVFFFAYIIFGMISSIIGYKLNGKIAITIPLAVLSPLVIGGTVIASQSTSTVNNTAFYLNRKDAQQPAGNQVNANLFYLNNNKDNLIIIPNGYTANQFSEKQLQYLKTAFSLSKNSASSWQGYSWTVVPYQMLDLFNFENQNIFDTFASSQVSNLDNYLYNKDNSSFIYSYDLKLNQGLKSYLVDTSIDPSVVKLNKRFLVPGALKNYSQINNLANTDIIYARVGADNFDIEYPEDKYTYATTNNLIGKLKWSYIKELLDSKVFNDYAKGFFNKLLEENEELKQASYSELRLIKSILLSSIEKELNNPQALINQIIVPEVSVLREDAIKNQIITTEVEKQVYLATAFIYYLYFTYTNNLLSDAILVNDSSENDQNEDNQTNYNFTPSTFRFQFGEFVYNIGGYGSYTAKQQIVNNKVIIRYDLNKSNNFLFQPLEQFASINRNKQIINKYGYIGIWVVLGFIFILINNVLYIKKDYR